MQLLKSQKNDVYDTIEAWGLSPANFEIVVDQHNTKIIAKNSDFKFIFLEDNDGDHAARYCPGKDKYIEEGMYVGGWDAQLQNIRSWVKNVSREQDQPDKWLELQKQIQNAGFEDIQYGDSKFSYQEYEVLDEKITKLKEELSKLDIVTEKIEAINAKLDHLLELAKKMNKSDWKDLFVGSIISLIMQMSIDKSTGKAVYDLVKNLFTSMLHLSIT